MEIMDDRHESASTLMISQLPTDQWYQSIDDKYPCEINLTKKEYNKQLFATLISSDLHTTIDC
jgi:hypothetical protein